MEGKDDTMGNEMLLKIFFGPSSPSWTFSSQRSQQTISLEVATQNALLHAPWVQSAVKSSGH